MLEKSLAFVVAHDYDLMMALKDYADFELLINYTRRWDERLRPLPPNVKWVNHFEKGRYDFALLNIDQQCYNLELNKSILARQMRQAIREIEPTCPVVWINHATPVYPEAFDDANVKTGYKSETLRKTILEVIGNDLMVVNSHQAVEDWKHGHAIIHGMDKDDWVYSEDKEPRSATFVSQSGIGDKYYNRSFLVAVMDILRERHGIRHQWINTPGCFNARDHKDYKEFLGKTLIYFNPTFASPMPRTRTEAMFSGCCIITTPEHDADTFIKEGYNGFLVPHHNPTYSAELIVKLLNDYQTAKKIGENARKTAIEIFGRERYKNDWLDFLTKNKILYL
jgi:glycosyltransferase involved in cell wall biosynthesis